MFTTRVPKSNKQNQNKRFSPGHLLFTVNKSFNNERY